MKPLFTALAPNNERGDILLSFSLLFQPWRWIHGRGVRFLEKAFRSRFAVPYAYAFTSGRGALTALLSSLHLDRDDEVLLQAYTCVAVPEPIIAVHAKPIYVDINSRTFTMSVEDLRKKITARSKVLIIQHTFGNPTGMDDLLALAREHDLFVIEDCAHALGAHYYDKLVGTFGDAAFFSFGRDKVISSVFGGMAITHQKTLGERLRDIQDHAGHQTYRWVFQQLIHPPLMGFVKKTYSFFLGKLLLRFLYVFHITSRAVYAKEKRGHQPSFLSKRLPNSLAILALHQFEKLARLNDHRLTLATLYRNHLADTSFLLPEHQAEASPSFLRYTLQDENADAILAFAKKHNVFLGDWYRTPLAPYGVQYSSVCYKQGSCPVAERVALSSFNLPTHIGIAKHDAERIVNLLTLYASRH
ncbi:MAG: hypothetical protein COU08_01920 [Candidatus Harrisonbacteria bacterium CG10_big_fil_rev_8_21_14_0_10_42_17]|uniref:Aminotransferase n=1 Tax=Candidatus Harrisonbacteria bacterium CG10_big_fil_rev_8_21_14_0_10_42_17 TaxID=1974584 RepID=A0A2M6WIK0_9BACT|nr:MAG: hypothetical protein COU08_01920 [Candidatus Harrisonbacteria bacterium CG10_big_fil_rev_8_21_14_0_10_42_17]